MIVTGSIERELLYRLRRGDEAAFLRIYETFWYKVFSVAFKRLRDRDVCEELTQELFLKLWEKRAELNIQQLENYLVVSIKHAVINHIQAGIAANKYLEHYTVFVQRNSLATEEYLQMEELNDVIERGLEKLPLKSQEVFRLSRLNNVPMEQIARHLNLSEKTVGYHLTKSLKFMRTFLRQHSLLCLLFFWV